MSTSSTAQHTQCQHHIQANMKVLNPAGKERSPAVTHTKMFWKRKKRETLLRTGNGHRKKDGRPISRECWPCSKRNFRPGAAFICRYMARRICCSFKRWKSPHALLTMSTCIINLWRCLKWPSYPETAYDTSLSVFLAETNLLVPELVYKLRKWILNLSCLCWPCFLLPRWQPRCLIRIPLAPLGEAVSPFVLNDVTLCRGGAFGCIQLNCVKRGPIKSTESWGGCWRLMRKE